MKSSFSDPAFGLIGFGLEKGHDAWRCMYQSVSFLECCEVAARFQQEPSTFLINLVFSVQWGTVLLGRWEMIEASPSLPLLPLCMPWGIEMKCFASCNELRRTWHWRGLQHSVQISLRMYT